MKCPYCDSNDTKVIDSRATEDNHAIRRRRLCQTCNKRFSTYERYEDQTLMVVKKDNNIVNIGTIILRYSTILGMTGLKLIIGQLPGLGAGVSRMANNCRVDIGNRVVINGVTLYLQEDDSCISIGDDSQLSWGVDIWCTDAHTITNLEGEPINFAKSIVIGKHVWIGKDVKVCKNVKVSDNSIIGWGSIVTRVFNEPNVIIAGVPAKVVKQGINWDRRCINKYLKG